MVADEKLTCLSNMDVKDTKSLGNGKKSVSFNKSPKMSTYVSHHLLHLLQGYKGRVNKKSIALGVHCW